MKPTGQQTMVGPYLWKSRIIRSKKGSASQKEVTYRSTSNGVPTTRDGYVADLRNQAQATMSRENPICYLGRKDHPEEIGGNFETHKIEVFLPSWNQTTFSNSSLPSKTSETGIPSPSVDLNQVHRLIRGLVNGVNPEDSGQLQNYILGATPTIYPENTMDVWGTQVIASVIPTNPVADLSTTLAEFASERKFFGIPSEKSTYAGEYLNFQFGVAPTVGFSQDLRKAIDNREKIIEQYERDAGKRVRRKFALPPVITTTKEMRYLPMCWYGQQAVPTSIATFGDLTIRTKTTQWKSFSGAFTYCLPKRGTIGGEIARLDKLYGVNPLNNLFGTGWELTPYSWLVDYFTSAGAYHKNLDAFKQDALVMPYGYVMFSQERELEYTWRGSVNRGSSTRVPYTCSGKMVYTTHQRRRATPYGFGKSSSDLTTKQWSILAALGISRVF